VAKEKRCDGENKMSKVVWKTEKSTYLLRVRSILKVAGKEMASHPAEDRVINLLP